MIQLYLLVLIIIFIVILFTIKEKFVDCEGENNVIDWSGGTGDNVGLYGCNSSTDKGISIKLTWKINKVDETNSSKKILIINTEDGKSSQIKDLDNAEESAKITSDEQNDKSPDYDIFTYELTTGIVENTTYLITLNYIKQDEKGANDIMLVSNTLKITATTTTNSISSESEQHKIMNSIRDKTFDIYL